MTVPFSPSSKTPPLGMIEELIQNGVPAPPASTTIPPGLAAATALLMFAVSVPETAEVRNSGCLRQQGGWDVENVC
jgi:hypothetical protein